MGLGPQGKSELCVQKSDCTSDHCHCHCVVVSSPSSLFIFPFLSLLSSLSPSVISHLFLKRGKFCCVSVVMVLFGLLFLCDVFEVFLSTVLSISESVTVTIVIVSVV